MSLLALGAMLEGRHEYMIVDGNLLPDPQNELDRLIREKQVDRLAITVMPGPQLNEAVPLCCGSTKGRCACEEGPEDNRFLSMHRPDKTE